MKSRNLVYSTDQGRLCPLCEHPIDNCTCKNNPILGDGNVRIMLETKARKGKGVTVVTGLAMTTDELKALAKKLKAQCGTGGSVKEGNIEIQGDNREKIKQLLEKEGIKSKLAGGR
ncbi:translation initiation factor Sui1 [Marinomonas spartinae]|uniref:Translation initiation factor Sui1 n=1 Tax=Marinomonas spartinae TaxID=1792290 RepID=A0A1A8TKE4_9GAMM|nr:stress response translation initiation inhibitor YciH [Marinomonas spartinae]SBS34007.1 translation initiation factor Sui1 [Marinomonas spartinae]SBS37895.1 translation initiation factor Sui1 [Marinomonas spartinae]